MDDPSLVSLTSTIGELIGHLVGMASPMVSAGLGFALDLTPWSGIVGAGPHQREHPADECPTKECIEHANDIFIPMPTAPRHDSRQKVDHERN
jgi:hypothetical protein